jgi:uncharacterized protein YegL
MARKKKVTQNAKSTQPVWVGLIIDESGSMEPYWDNTIQSFNEYLDDRKKDAELRDVRVFLVKFSSHVGVLQSNVPANSVEKLSKSNYHPGGMTALYDAIGKTVNEIESKLREYKGEKPRILVMTMTDGMENQSRFFRKDTIAELIKAKEQEGNWMFTFMGTSKDALMLAKDINISPNNSVGYSVDTLKFASKGISLATSNYADVWNIEADLPCGFFMGADTAESLDPATKSSASSSVAPKKSRKKTTSTK